MKYSVASELMTLWHRGWCMHGGFVVGGSTVYSLAQQIQAEAISFTE